MNLTAKIKLQPMPEQHRLLLETLETANADCNVISQQAWDAQTFQQYPLHHLVYHDIRAWYGLAAQVTVRAISKVADAYKLDRKTPRIFAPHGAFPYDARILSFQFDTQTINIWTLGGRQRMGYVCGARQRDLLDGERGEVDLCYLNGD
ncbi:MAG: transposase, partial [Anaerolineae bacterium]|nr:transposase [Anaerolineae bacterium]